MEGDGMADWQSRTKDYEQRAEGQDPLRSWCFMNAMPVSYESCDSQELIALLSEQRDLYAQLRQLAGGQRELITGEAPERLLSVLVERQRIIDRLELLARRLRPYQQNWRSVRAGLSAEEGRRADALVAEVNALLKGILDADATDAELLAARKSETARNMQTTKAARYAGAAYGAGQAASGGQIDWTDE